MLALFARPALGLHWVHVSAHPCQEAEATQEVGGLVPKRIENPGSPEDYVDGLRGKGDARWHYARAEEHPPVSPESTSTRPIKDIATGLSMPVKCLVAAAIFIGGMAVHAVAFSPDIDGIVNAEVARRDASTVGQQAQPEPGPDTTPAVKVVNRPTLTSECKRALDGMAAILENASAVASVNNKQLDIFAETRQAIISKDFRKINELEERQRKLDSDFSRKRIPVVKVYPDIQKDLKSCRSQPSSR